MPYTQPSVFAPEGAIPLEDSSHSILDMADAVNERKLRDEKRWGLRPCRVNVYTAYGFDEGFLVGWSAGFGYRRESANIMGEISNGEGIEGASLRYADLILPFRLSIDDYDGWQIPGGGGGPSYARFDLPMPAH